MTVSVMPRRGPRVEPRFYNSRTTPENLPTDPTADSESGPEEALPAPSLLASAATAAGPAARRARTGAGAWMRRSGARVRQFVLSAAGLGAFAVGGFEAHPVAGWIITGLSLLMLEHQAKS